MIGAEKLTQLLASTAEYWNNTLMSAELPQREGLMLDQVKMCLKHLRTSSATLVLVMLPSSLAAGSMTGSGAELPVSTLATGSRLGVGPVVALLPSSLTAGSMTGARAELPV